MNVRKGEITTGRFLVPYRVYGQGGQSMFCVNAMQQTMAAWRSVVRYFSETYQLVLFDFPGQGRGRILSGSADVTLDEQVQVLNRVLLEQNPRGKSHVVGASWGSIIVAVFAARFPELVDKIILASFGIRTNEKLQEVIRAGQQLYDNGEVEKVADLIIKHFGQHLNETFKKRIYSQFRNITKEQYRTFHEHGKSLQIVQRISEVVDLSRIEAQTLIINGEKDEIMDLTDVNFASAQIPRCEVKIVSGVGHFLHNESSKVLPMYRRFLSLPLPNRSGRIKRKTQTFARAAPTVK
jgi:pimeloyl-ACP methyl ester carboxylesterase